MTNWELFRSLNYVSAENLSGAEALQSAAPRPRRAIGRRTLLVAAAIMLALLLVGCAVAYASGWFRQVFDQRSEAPLSEDQIRYLESNERAVEQTQGKDDWSVELKSTISDGTAAYLVFRVTAPEGTDLEQYLDPPSFDAKHLMPGNYSVGKKAAYSMVVASIGTLDPEKNYMYNDGGDWMPDNDGRTNTVLYCMTIRCNKLYPDKPMGLEQPFGKGCSFRIRFMGVSVDYTDPAVAESIDARYAGQAYIVDGEEAAGLFRADVLTDKEWDFEVTLDADNQFMELISRPVAAQAKVFYYTDAEKSSVYTKQESIGIRSFRVTPFGASTTFDLTEDMHGASLEPDPGTSILAVMKDGSSIPLQWDGDRLLAQTPIVLSRLDYVLLADGTKLEAVGIR